MANETNQYMNQNGYSVHIDADNPEQSYFTANTSNGNLRYVPKEWKGNELIEQIEMNNIEQGIQIALAQTSNITDTAREAISTVNEALNNFRDLADDVEEELNTAKTNIENSVDSKLTTQSTNVLGAFTTLLGSYYTINSLTAELGSGKQTVDARIVELYNTIFSNGTNNIVQLQNNLTDLNTYVRGQQNSNSLTAQIIALQNELGGSGSGTSFREKIELAIGRPLEPTTEQINANENLSENLLTLIENLQGVLGLSNTSAGELSLIQKIEGMIGRSLNTENGETIDQQTGEYSNSIMTIINQIKGVLGIEGGVSGGGNSNLVADVNTALNILYGYTIVDNEIERNNAPNLMLSALTNSYPTLYNDFYNATINYNEPILNNEGKPVLDENNNPTYNTVTQTGSLSTLLTNVYSRIGNVDSANNYIINLLSNYSNLNAKATNSYEAAETSVYNDNTYLILKRNQQATIAESINDFNETGEYNGSTYIQLPKGGGGGGSEYTNIARFTDVIYPTNTSLVIGDTCNITFTWSVVDDENHNVPLVGNLTIRISGTSVYSTTIDANTSITYNLGQYINTSGRNNVTITVTNPAVVTRTLYITLTAYQATLISSFNENEIQTNSSIEYSYLASIGSNIVTKVLHIEIDGTEINLSNNETLTETQNSVVFTTPSTGSHLMKVWFTAQISETITITSQALYYGIICGNSPTTVIATNFINGVTVERYSTIIIHYLVVTPNQNTTKVEFFINNNEEAIRTLDVPATYQDWSYTVTNGTGPLTIKIKANGAEKILTATVIDENHYDLSMVTTGLKLYLTADQRSNTGANTNVWTNSASAVISNIYQEQINQIDPDEVGISDEERLKRQAQINELQNTLTNTLSLIPSVTANMENFLFYKNVDGWQQDNDGAYFLRLRNQNKIIIPFSIFNTNIAETGATFEIDFKTQDVADYDARIVQCFEGNNFATSTKNILLTAQNAIINNVKGLSTQYKEEEKITLTFIINPSRPSEGSTRTATKTDGLLYIYINGILSAATPYQEVGADTPNLGFTDSSTAKIVLGTPDCTLDLYSIKYYNRALTYKEVIKNWVFNTGNFNDKIDRFMRNNYTTLSIQQFIDNSKNTPYMIITGEGPLDGEDAFMPQQKGSEYKKVINVEYVDPINPEYSFSANSRNTVDFTGKAEAQVQGTSSQAYFRKNYKIKLSSFTQNGIFHIKSPGDEYYDIVYETTTNPETGEETQVEISRTLKENISKDGYKLSASSFPEFTFCIKADVASSESVNNTGLTMIYDEVARNFMLTPPQYDDTEDKRIRQGVEGYPMVAWYRDSVNGTETLLGKYNFNNDKGTAKVYGLKSDLDLEKTIDQRSFSIENGIYDESWEVKNNDAGSLVMFEVPGTAGSPERDAAWLNYTYDKDNKIQVDPKNSNAVLAWQNSFESRFPDQDDEGIALINPNASATSGEINIEQSSQTEIAYLNKRLAGLREMVEWVNDIVEWAPTFNNTNWELIEEPSTTDQNEAIEWQMNGVYNLNDKVNFENSIYKSLVNNNILGTNKTRITSASASNFKAGFENYFNLKALLFFYNFTELFLMVDSRAKNMFWTRYQVRNGKRPKKANYNEDVNTLAPDNFGYFGWFTLPYDFDTALGINNQGKNVYDYHWESLDVTGPDGSAIFGGQYSKLWVAFRQVYAAEIAVTFQQMSAYIDYNKVENLFKRNQSIWSETIVNEDMIAKYINWAADIGYDMLLGLKDMQRKWWLWNRFKYFKSKYALERGTDNINIRVHVNNANIPVQVYADSYVSLNVGANGAPTTVRVLRGQTGYLTGGSNENTGSTDSSGIETYISPASALKSVQNLSTLKISSIDVSKAIRLQELQIGTPNYEQRNELLRSASVAPAEGYSSLLRYIDLRNCTNLGIAPPPADTPSPELNVSGCLFLNRIYLAGTPLHKVNLPNGGVLKTIQYPTTIKEIKIENQPFLENLIIGAYLPLDEITDSTYEFANTNHINDYTGINKLYLDNVGILTNRTNTIDSLEIVQQMNTNGFLYLDGISWEMTASKFYTIFQKINTMYGFINGQANTDTLASIGGTLYLSGEFPEGFSIEDIGARFGSKLKVYWVDGQGQSHEYYTVSFYSADKQLLETQYIAENNSAVNHASQFFTSEYIDNYNRQYIYNWENGSPTRYNFKEWDTSLNNIQQNTEITAVFELQYRMNFVIQKETIGQTEIKFDYFFENSIINDSNIIVEPFTRNYYKYTKLHWTTNATVPENSDCVQNGDNREEVSGNALRKTNNEDGIQTWYAVYSRSPQSYYVKLYNVDSQGNKTPLKNAQNKDIVFERAVVSMEGSSLSTYITQSDVSSYIPNEQNQITMVGDESEKTLPDNQRTYRFLNWQPYIPGGNGLKVTGNMDICLSYYKIDDVFTNYFLNKLTTTTIANVSVLPKGAFFQNSNLEKLTITGTNLVVGDYAFANFNTNKRKIFIFDVTNITLGQYCFYYLKNAIIVFNGTGTISVNNHSFDNMTDCSILIPNTPQDQYSTNFIRTEGEISQCFNSFLGSNTLYVKNKAEYPTGDTAINLRVPSELVKSEKEALVLITDNAGDTYHQLMEEAGLL